MALTLQIIALLFGLCLFGFGAKALIVAKDYDTGGLGIVALGIAALAIGFLLILGAGVWMLLG